MNNEWRELEGGWGSEVTVRFELGWRESRAEVSSSKI